jgi:hypothetical protein
MDRPLLTVTVPPDPTVTHSPAFRVLPGNVSARVAIGGLAGRAGGSASAARRPNRRSAIGDWRPGGVRTWYAGAYDGAAGAATTGCTSTPMTDQKSEPPITQAVVTLLPVPGAVAPEHQPAPWPPTPPLYRRVSGAVADEKAVPAPAKAATMLRALVVGTEAEAEALLPTAVVAALKAPAPVNAIDPPYTPTVPTLV